MFGIVLVFWSQNCVFLASPRKTMQNHLEISSKIQFWIQSVRNLTKSRHSGPIWARMGPARALEEREKFRKNAPFFKHIFMNELRFWHPCIVF